MCFSVRRKSSFSSWWLFFSLFMCYRPLPHVMLHFSVYTKDDDDESLYFTVRRALLLAWHLSQIPPLLILPPLHLHSSRAFQLYFIIVVVEHTAVHKKWEREDSALVKNLKVITDFSFCVKFSSIPPLLPSHSFTLIHFLAHFHFHFAFLRLFSFILCCAAADRERVNSAW